MVHLMQSYGAHRISTKFVCRIENCAFSTKEKKIY